MRTAAYKEDIASDRRRHWNVPRHILCSILGACPAKLGHTNRCKSDYGNHQ